jgi:hypothetical protein
MQKLNPRSIGLLTIASDAKTKKGYSYGYATGILYLAPHKQGGFGNVCPFASKGCAESCLYSAGRGKMSSVQKARIEKTRKFFTDQKGFITELIESVRKAVNYVERKDFIPCIRLNGTSDIPFERLTNALNTTVIDSFPKVQFYDYTKNPNRIKAYIKGYMPKNYHLTFSLSESNREVAFEMLKLGGNVAMVFNTGKKEDLPETYSGFKVIDGDKSDLRFLDDSNVIVGLRAKGDAKHDTSGFVIHV